MRLLSLAGVILGVMKLVGVAAVANLSWWWPVGLFFAGPLIGLATTLIVIVTAYLVAR